MHMTAILTQRCNNRCRHCYLSAVHYKPNMKDDLSRDDFENAFRIMGQLFSDEVEEIYLTGGEFALLSYREEIVDITRCYFPGSTIIAYTNGLLFLEDESLIEDIRPDAFHLGIDRWHLNVDSCGRSRVAEYFIDRLQDENTGIIIHWTRKDDDRDIFDKFRERYAGTGKNLVIEDRPLNTAVGRAARFALPSYNEDDIFRACDFADHLRPEFNGLCYGCHYGPDFAALGRFDSPELGKKMDELKNSGLGRLLRGPKSQQFFRYLCGKYNISFSRHQCGMCETLVKQGIDMHEQAVLFHSARG